MAVRAPDLRVFVSVRTKRPRDLSQLTVAATIRGTITVAAMIQGPVPLVKSATDGLGVPGGASRSMLTMKRAIEKIAQAQPMPTIARAVVRTFALSAPASPNARSPNTVSGRSVSGA